MEFEEVLECLKSLSNPEAVAGMARFGITPGNASEKFNIGMIDTIKKVEENIYTIKSILSEVKGYRSNL